MCNLEYWICPIGIPKNSESRVQTISGKGDEDKFLVGINKSCEITTEVCTAGSYKLSTTLMQYTSVQSAICTPFYPSEKTGLQVICAHVNFT